MLIFLSIARGEPRLIYTPTKKVRIYTLVQQNMPRSKIIAQFSYTSKTIIRIIKRYDSKHSFYPKYHNAGCSKSLTEKNSLQAELALKKGLVSTAIEFRDQFFSNISASTVYRMLNNRGYKAYRCHKAIYLTPEQKRKRKI